VALTFSSTIIIVKLLSDKREIDSLHGQIAVGFLIVQDIAAILALVFLTTFGGGLTQEGSAFQTTLIILAKGIGLLIGVALLMRFVIPDIMQRLAHSQETMTLFAIAWAVFLGAGSEWMGFSKEVGAFLAGVSLASTGYRDAIGARLTTLRDFLLLFFFIHLGAQLDWSTVGSQLGASAIFSAFVLIGNPLIVLVIMGAMGYRRRTGFLAGLTVAQISEFSLIVAALGMSIGHITPETMGLITLVGVVTIFASTYMILYSQQLYRLLSEPLKIFERANPYREGAVDSLKVLPSVDVILAGLGNYGSGLAEYLLQRKKTVIGVDFDPGALAFWRSRGMSVLYGDMGDPEIHEQLPMHQARWVVSTVRERDLNLALLALLKARDYEGKIALTAVNQAEAELYQQAGAHVVFRPFSDAAEQAADALTHAMDVLPGKVDWPVAFREVRIQSGSAFSGKMLREIPLRSVTGASILAVSRAGRVKFDPGPDYQIYPGDRLVIVGPLDDLRKAEDLLQQLQDGDDQGSLDRFEVEDIRVKVDPGVPSPSLSDLQFRQRYGVTVVGIRRGEERITSPGPGEPIHNGDHLIVIGTSQAVDSLKAIEPIRAGSDAALSRE
jgi:Trk K+ transport system NAD-binding subunit